MSTLSTLAQMDREIEAARKMRDAITAYEAAEERGFTQKAIRLFNAKERAIEQYDAVRADSEATA